MQIGVRELRANLAGLVRRAQAGESIVVTKSGRPAAVLGPVGGRREVGLEGLVAMGAVLAPRARTARPAITRTPLPVDARSDVELRKVR